MLTVVGDLLADVVVLGASAYERGTDNPARITHARGGSAANVAAAAAPLTATRFIGRVGADAEGYALAERLAAAGVDVRVQREGRTGSIVILVDDTAERTMLTDRGAAAELDDIDLEWLDGTRWLHLPLYGFVEPASRRALVAVASELRGRGIPISVDLSSVVALRELGRDALTQVLRDCAAAVVFANADEADVFDSWRLPHDVAETFVVKRGPDPILVVMGDHQIEVPVDAVDDIVDTTGAGDAFAAGYLVAALAGETAERCAKAGAGSARGALRRPGAI
jgi:sugar/nucleoside kinase (ribokinase family)